MTGPAFPPGFAEDLDRLFRWRRDVRWFRPDPVAPADLAAVLASAALAPSVGNAQPWRFVRLRSPGLRDVLAAHVDGMAEAAAGAMAPPRAADHRRLKLHGLREAPELLAVFCDEAPAAGHGLGRATMGETLRWSTAMAVHTLWLAARARGLGLGWVSILDPAHVAALLDVAPDWTLVALLCLGHPARASEVPELEERGWQAREPLVVLER